jgi:hypothetical protein
VTLTAGHAAAQSSFAARPSFGLFQVYDDNLFFTESAPQADVLWRLSPHLALDRRSGRLSVHAEYGFDAELFRRRSDLNGVAAHEAALDVSWKMSRRLALHAGAAYARAQTPGALNTLTGLQIGRRSARQLSAATSLMGRVDARTEVTLGHDVTRQQVEGDPDHDTHAVGLVLEHRLRGADRVRVAYGIRRYHFGAEPVVSHVATLGWTHAVTSRLQLDLDAGPHWSGQTLGTEVSAALRRRFRRGEAGLAYSRGQTTVLGGTGPVTAEGVTATFSRQMGRLRLAGNPSLFRVSGPDTDSTVRRLGVQMSWRLTSRLDVVASHELTVQRGSLGAATGTDARLTRHTVRVGVTATGSGLHGERNARPRER